MIVIYHIGQSSGSVDHVWWKIISNKTKFIFPLLSYISVKAGVSHEFCAFSFCQVSSELRRPSSSWDRPCQAEDPSSVMSYCNYLSCSRLHLIDLTSGKFSDGQLIQLKTPSCQLNSSQMSVHGHVHTNDSALDLRNIIINWLKRIRFGRRWTWLHFLNSMVTVSWTKFSRKNEIWAILTSSFLLNLKILQNTISYIN